MRYLGGNTPRSTLKAVLRVFWPYTSQLGLQLRAERAQMDNTFTTQDATKLRNKRNAQAYYNNTREEVT